MKSTSKPCKSPAAEARRSAIWERIAAVSASMASKDRRVPAERSPLVWEAAELSDRSRRLSLEWLETDGLGGYASGTVAGARTRRHHGWYVPAIPPPRRRWMFVSSCDEFVTVDGEETGISTQIYKGATFPEGDTHLVRFALEPFPVWRYETETFAIERSLCLVRDRSVTIVRYRNCGDRELALSVRPLLRFRGAGELRSESDEIEDAVEIRGELSWLRPAAFLPRLFLRAVGAETRADPLWYRQFAYEAERAPGEESPTEDLWSPVRWSWTLAPEAEAWVLFSREEIAGDPWPLYRGERERRDQFAPLGDSSFDELSRRAENFLVEDREGSLLAGFPSLADQGRDAMVAAAGIAMATGKFGAVARVINAFASMRREGLVPARFGSEKGQPEYDSVDAPLWMILAIEWFGRWRKNPSLPPPLLGAVRSILSSLSRGTRFGIGVAGDGLLEADSPPGKPLTWMDSVVDRVAVTPRDGRCVEVNALWHAALQAAARLERLANESARARELEGKAWHVARKFNEAFWCAEREHLYDVVGNGPPDASLRPNQIFAVSLTEDLLPPHRARSVYWTVRRRLLTPYGLRTLDTRDSRYRGTSGGTHREQALAAHQGSAWPWLLGAFADAHFRVNPRGEETLRTFRNWLAPFRAHIREAGLGSISESFDGDPPHSPRGAIARATSVAELIRAVATHLGGGLATPDPPEETPS
ncbi:MAG: amylo-alpha-1,6-glucosidase [Acidobacteriota bacterium]|nr:amylo-alpha-1,6-glucosidase [Acidobacteriota bacterium]